MNDKIAPLNITVKRTVSNGKIYELIDLDTYKENPDNYLGRNDVGIEINSEVYDETLVLPLRDTYNGNPITPGVYNAGAISFIIEPDISTYKKYIPEKTISLGNNMDIKSILEAGELVNKLDEPFITTPDNITKIPITSVDEPEMRALKSAINAKCIDLDKYAPRFGDNYPNDKRQLKNNQVTLNIIKRFCNNLDMEATLTIKDKNSDVPNPLDTEIVVSLTSDYSDDDNN